MVVPTRTEIQTKINQTQGMQSDKRNAVANWLDTIECPPEDKEKILDDLESYANY